MRQSLLTMSAIVVLACATSLLPWAVGPGVAETRGNAAELTQEQQIIHLLYRMGYGPRPGDIERVKRIGIDQYIQQQLHPEHIDDSATEARVAGLDSLRMTIPELIEKYPEPQMVARQTGISLSNEANPEAQPGLQTNDADASPGQQAARQQLRAYYTEHGLKLPRRVLQELQAQKLIRAVYSERQLQEVMTDFWFNHFNVSWSKGVVKWLATDFEMGAIRPHAMGQVKDLLLATAKSPAMLFYLDNFLSSSPDAKLPERPPANQVRNRQPGINENYARELLELHTLGVDGGYTQKDVQEVARCFTGWTLERPRQEARFVFREGIHDPGEKVVLGHRIPAGGGITDGEMVIELLARHPSTARFIASKLVRRFVSDTPPSSLIERVAGVYMGTDGNIREMLRTIFTAPEFTAQDVYRAKIKSPFELAVSAIRALGGNTDGAAPLMQFVTKMGQPLYLYQPPTGFPDRAEQWVNSGALLERLNFGLALSANRIAGTRVDLTPVTAGIEHPQGKELIERAIAVLLHGDVSPHTRTVLTSQLTENLPGKDEANNASSRAKPLDDQPLRAVGLALGSPEFQRR